MNERWWGLARAPDQRVEEARRLFDSGMKLIEISERGTPGESQMLSEDWETDPADGERRWAGSAEIEIHKRTEMGRSSFENELQPETGT